MAKAKKSVAMGKEVTPPKSRAKKTTKVAKAAPPPEPVVIPELSRRRWRLVIWALPAVLLVAVALVGGFMALYAGKIYPGTSVDGTYLGGLDRATATATLKTATQAYGAQAIPVTYGNATISLGVAQIGTKYDIDGSVEQAYSHGRGSNLSDDLRQVVRSLVGRTTKLSDLTYSDAQLTPYLDQIGQSVTIPVTNAGLAFSGSSVTVVPSQPGRRLDTGQLVRLVQQRLAAASTAPVVAPVYSITPIIDDAGLAAAKSQADGYLAGPITLTLPSKTVTVGPSDITGWITVNRPADDSGLAANLKLSDFNYTTASAPITLGLNDGAIAGYVAALAKTVDVVGQNAALTITNGTATVFQPEKTGYTLDQTGATTAIEAALAKPAAGRTIALNVKVTQPDVTAASLNSLGINQLLSEGITYFPGSPAVRIHNIRTGAARFNGVLIKPGDTFSFESLLGDVDAATGYVPAIVIVGNKEDYQYGGGLCQVSTTAYRAALLAGLPIVERHNHSYAVSYYTAPFGVPGVDATIFNASVDFKFLNNTGHYILIQTILSGTTLKFDFYGTKVESGQIRGPYFIDPAGGAGWNPTVPSTTVFYRDILDSAGNVTKTDTITTHYASSNDFPLTPQFN